MGTSQQILPQASLKLAENFLVLVLARDQPVDIFGRAARLNDPD